MDPLYAALAFWLVWLGIFGAAAGLMVTFVLIQTMRSATDGRMVGAMLRAKQGRRRC